MALASAAAFEGQKLKLCVAAGIIDHGLQLNSDLVASNTAVLCQRLGMNPVLLSRVTVKKTGDGLEADARQARYFELEAIGERLGAKAILLGHNLGDQAETVLLGLIRGSGLSAISGMTQIDEARGFIRPLLELSRAQLRQSVLDQGLEIWDDPQNLDEKFTRVKVRRILNQLEAELAPGITESLSKTALIAREAADYLVEEAVRLEVAAKVSEGCYSIAVLETAHAGLRRQALHRIALGFGAKNLSRAQVLQVDALIMDWHGQKPLTLSGITVGRVNNQLILSPRKPLNPGA